MLAGATLNGAFLVGALTQAGGPPPEVIAYKLAGWALFGATLPLLLWAAGRLQLQRPGAHRRLPALLGVIAATALLTELALPTGMVFSFSEAAGATEPPARVAALVEDGVTIKLILSLGIAFVLQLVLLRREERARRTNDAELERRLAEGQLEVLRRRLDPHFLFNALNSVVSLMRRDPAAAGQMLGDLRCLMEESLRARGLQLAPLGDELRLLRRYLAIERRRLGERLRLVWEIEEGSESAAVPTLLLQPIVENAVRHGIASRAAGGVVHIRARRDQETLLLEVVDDGPGPGNVPWRRGIGLSTTLERLRLLYGGGHTVTLGAAAGGGFRVAIALPFAAPAER